MGIQRATVLYPVNGTTVDSGSGIDIRLLTNTAASADTSQTVTATHTQDNVARTFDPATAGATAATAPTTLQNLGWALRLSEDMTPADDTNCNAVLTSGTLTVNLDVTLVSAGGNANLGGTTTTTFQAGLFRYDPASDSGSLVASGTGTQSWNTAGLGGDAGTYKAAAVNVPIASPIEFNQGEILLLQVGFSDAGTLSNPTLGGTTTFTWTLRLGSGTNVTFATDQGIRQVCQLQSNNLGKGSVTKSPFAISAAPVLISGKGSVGYSKASTVSKTFSLQGKGTPNYNKFTTAYRSFALQGVGKIPTSGSNTSTITLPIDEVPDGSGGGGETVNNYFFPILD